MAAMRNSFKSQKSFWAGWGLFLVGMFFPVLYFELPNPQIVPLVFLGLPIPSIDETGNIETLGLFAVSGWLIMKFFIIETLGKLAGNPKLAIFLLFSLPLIMALFSPLLLRLKSRLLLWVMALAFGLAFVLNMINLVVGIIHNEQWAGAGYYLWIAAFGLLAVSIILHIRDSATVHESP